MSLKRSSKLSSSSGSRKSSPKKNEGEDISNIEELEGIYLSVMQNLEEEISSQEELTLLLQHAGYNPSKKMLEKYWGPTIDSYDFNQFCAILKQETKPRKKDLLRAFQKIDRNGDGYITHDELFQVLTKRGERMTKSEVKSMIDDADFNGDGKLDYEEFCDMMDSTTRQCKQLYGGSVAAGQKNNRTSLNDLSSSQRGLSRKNLSSVKEEKRNSVMREEKEIDRKSSRTSILSKISSKEDSGDEMKKNVLQKLKADPQDLNRWQFHSTKGCFYKEDDGKIESHHYQMKITQPTTVWITIKAAAPKYGKFNDEILDSDMTVFLVDESHGNKLISFTNSIINGKYCLQADVDIGVYNILTFSTGNKLFEGESSSGQMSLVKGDDAKLTKPCKDTLTEIFYRCDLDGNGYLSREEFNEFQMRASGEGCDDEAWDVVKETIEVNDQFEITPNGFMKLSLMEARDPDGGQDELWVTLESMGYSRKLQLTKSCPFQMEIYTKRGKNNISLLGVSDGGAPLHNAMMDSIKAISLVKQIKSKRDLHLHVAEFVDRTSLAVDNQSHSIVGIQVDCTGSENLVSNQGDLDNVEDINPKSMAIVHHLTRERKKDPIVVRYQENVIR